MKNNHHEYAVSVKEMYFNVLYRYGTLIWDDRETKNPSFAPHGLVDILKFLIERDTQMITCMFVDGLTFLLLPDRMIAAIEQADRLLDSYTLKITYEDGEVLGVLTQDQIQY